jgi:hypothetical protein
MECRMELLKRPGRATRKRDVLIGTWNVRNLYQLGASKKLEEELKKYKEILEEEEGRADLEKRWLDDVQDDMIKMGVKRWRTKAMDRGEWRKYVRRPRFFKNCRTTKKKKKKKKKKKRFIMEFRFTAVLNTLQLCSKHYMCSSKTLFLRQ